MSKVKSISKRTLALILSLLMLLSSGIVGTLAANVDLAPVGAGTNWQGKIYFKAPDNWNLSGKHVQIAITQSSSASSGTEYAYVVGTMTKVTNSENLYYYSSIATDHSSWGNTEYIAFIANGSEWKTGDFYISTCEYYTAPSSYRATNSSNYYLYKASTEANDKSTSVKNNVALSGSYNSSRRTILNEAQTINLTNNGTASSAVGTVKVVGRYDSADATVTSSTTTSSSSSVKYADAAIGSKVELTATPASGYSFVGWYDDSTLLSSSTSYSYTVYTTKTLEARFKEANYSYTVEASPTAGGTVSPTSGTVTPGSGVTVTAQANEGYTFTGWTGTNGTFADASALSTTFTPKATGAVATANFAKNTYTVTFNDHDGTFLGTDTVEHGSTAEAPVTPSRTGYTFDGWSESLTNVTGDMTVTAQYTINTYKLTISGFDSTKAELDIDGTSYFDDDVISKTYGETASVTITPNEGQVLTVNGVEVTYGESYEATITFDKNQTLTLGFNIKTFNVTINYAANRPKSVIIGNTEYSTTAGSTQVQLIPYGTNTLKITALDNYYIQSVVGNGVNVNYDHNGTMPDELSFDINVTDDCTISISSQAKPKFDIKITTITDGTTETFLDTSKYYGNSYTINVPAKEGYYISSVTGTINGASVNNTSSDYSNDIFTKTIDFLEADTELTVYYTAIPTFEVTVEVNDANGGTATGTGIKDGVVTVYSGSKAYLSATANTGYRFTGWTVEPAGAVNTALVDLSQLSIDFVPQEDVTLTANFEAVTGTINVTAGDGGTVTYAGTHNVIYPETVTATATPNESEGYQFTHWTVESEGTADVNYIVTENDNVITVQILTQDTVVNVTANFANSQKIKVYTYSDAGFNKLHLTETKGSDTKEVYNATQTLVRFGDKHWYTPSIGELTLTAGYYDAINAQLLTGSSVEGGTIIYVELSDAWMETAYAYKEPHLAVTSSTNSSWSEKIGVSNTTGVDRESSSSNNTNYRADKDTYIGGGTYVSGNIYKFVIPSASLNDLQNYGFTVYSKQWINNDMWELNIAHGTYSSTDNRYKISESNKYNEDRRTFCFDISADDNMPSQTEVVDIVDALYNDKEWRGLDEIWLYFDNNDGYTATNRRQLNDYVTGSLIKNAYNYGENDEGYTDESWSDFTSAYENAMDTLGAGASTQADIDSAYSNLKTKFEALGRADTVTVTGSNGAMPGFGTYYGTISFPGLTVESHTGNIGDADSNGSSPSCTYYTATVTRGQSISINTTVNDSDYMVLGWVVNGTEFIEATQDIENTNLFTGTYPCENNAVIIPVYFRDDTIAKYNSENEEEKSQVIKLYAKGDDSSTTWGNYISAYTWTANAYKQFGRWTGQVMIPDRNNPGMYYTYVEKFDPENTSDVVEGITFNNYGDNTGIYTGDRYQAYDYYEFIGLAEDGYDTIVFELNESDGVQNWPSKSAINVESNDYNFYPFVDFSGNEIDISRTKLTDEQKALDTALYIVRTGPCDADDSEVGKPTGSVIDGEYFINCYIYNAKTGAYIGACKSYELLDLEALKNGSRKLDLTEYIGKPVEIDYASLTVTNAKRYDGEWYGTKYGLTNVTIKAEVAFQNEDGSIRYFQGQNNVDGVGQAYFNREHFQEVPHGSEGHTINAIVADGNDFVGWYKATVADNGSYTIDATAEPLIIERSSTIDASADAVYVAVFKEHPEGTFTVNNYYYTYKDFEGQPMGEPLPPVFGGDISYSIRDVRIQKTKNYDNSALTDKDDPGFAGTYTQSMEVAAGDELTITIRTTPTYKQRDYVYAWYIQANEADGKINFEEVGTNVIQGDTTPGATKEFTFTYTVEEGVNNITIYSDVVHITPEVTFTYIYSNRYNETRTYVVKHTLTDDELTNYTPSMETIRDLAPYVGDIYKNVTWEIENISSDATNWTLRASEADVYKVNINVDGIDAETIYGKFNETVSIYAKDINPEVTGNKGIWYVDKVEDGQFVAGEDEILGYGTYYGLVITGDVNVCFTSVEELMNQIILADAVYGYERATDGSGNETINKVYVDYLISMLLNVYTGGFIDVNGNGKRDTDTEPTVIDEENTNTPVSLKAIEAAGYEVDYGMVHELLNTFGDNKDDIIEEFYGNESTAMSDASLTQMLIDNKATSNGATANGALATLLYKYSAIDYKDYATNKNRVIMTFGFDNTEYYRNLYYNVKAYLTISAPETTTMTDDNTFFLFSNTATLNIAEDDKVTNGEATNS